MKRLPGWLLAILKCGHSIVRQATKRKWRVNKQRELLEVNTNDTETVRIAELRESLPICQINEVPPCRARDTDPGARTTSSRLYRPGRARPESGVIAPTAWRQQLRQASDQLLPAVECFYASHS